MAGYLRHMQRQAKVDGEHARHSFRRSHTFLRLGMRAGQDAPLLMLPVLLRCTERSILCSRLATLYRLQITADRVPRFRRKKHEGALRAPNRSNIMKSVISKVDKYVSSKEISMGECRHIQHGRRSPLLISQVDKSVHIQHGRMSPSFLGEVALSIV